MISRSTCVTNLVRQSELLLWPVQMARVRRVFFMRSQMPFVATSDIAPMMSLSRLGMTCDFPSRQRRDGHLHLRTFRYRLTSPLILTSSRTFGIPFPYSKSNSRRAFQTIASPSIGPFHPGLEPTVCANHFSLQIL